MLEKVLPNGTLLVRERTENHIGGLEKLVGCRFVAPVRTNLKSFVWKKRNCGLWDFEGSVMNVWM